MKKQKRVAMGGFLIGIVTPLQITLKDADVITDATLTMIVVMMYHRHVVSFILEKSLIYHKDYTKLTLQEICVL